MIYASRLLLPALLLASTALLQVAPAVASPRDEKVAGVHNATREDLPAVDQTLAVRSLVSAVIQALASEPPPESAEPWRSAVVAAAAELLPEGRLAALLAEPAIVKAVAWGARGVQCTVVSGAGSPSHGKAQLYFTF